MKFNVLVDIDDNYLLGIINDYREDEDLSELNSMSEVSEETILKVVNEYIIGEYGLINKIEISK